MKRGLFEKERMDLVCRKTNRKSQKLSPLSKNAEKSAKCVTLPKLIWYTGSLFSNLQSCLVEMCLQGICIQGRPRSACLSVQFSRD